MGAGLSQLPFLFCDLNCRHSRLRRGLILSPDAPAPDRSGALPGA
jgi:hypothetical protein